MIATISKERWLQQYQLVKTQFWILMFSICFLIFSFSAAVICRDSAEYPAAAVFEIEFNAAIAEYEATGTTLIAAEQLNRRCFICELDPHYCDIIIARWEKLTGKKAELVKT